MDGSREIDPDLIAALTALLEALCDAVLDQTDEDDPTTARTES